MMQLQLLVTLPATGSITTRSRLCCSFLNLIGVSSLPQHIDRLVICSVSCHPIALVFLVPSACQCAILTSTRQLSCHRLVLLSPNSPHVAPSSSTHHTLVSPTHLLSPNSHRPPSSLSMHCPYLNLLTGFLVTQWCLCSCSSICLTVLVILYPLVA